MFYTGINARSGRVGAQVRGARACTRRAYAPFGRSGGGPSTRLWRGNGGGPCQRTVPRDCDRWHSRTQDRAEAECLGLRRKGAGRKRTVDRDITLKRDLEALVEPVTRAAPESALRWTCKSVRQLASELQR